MKTQKQLLEEIKERVKKASFGPWIVERTKKFSGDNWLIASCGNSYDGLDNFVTTSNQRGSETNFEADAQTDAEFMAHSRTDIPALLQILEIQQKALEGVKPFAEACKEHEFNSPGKTVYAYNQIPLTFDALNAVLEAHTYAEIGGLNDQMLKDIAHDYKVDLQELRKEMGWD